MDYRLSVKGFDFTNAMTTYLEKRLEKIDRVLNDSVHLEIKFEKDATNFVGKFSVHYLGKDLIVTEQDPDIYTVIDKLSDAFEKKIKREKDYVRPRHKSNNKGLGKTFTEEMPIKKEQDKISSIKRLGLMITSVEEALEQMEVMNHEFFLFRNMDTDEINLILKRHDGTLILYEFVE
ncbi:HPF/RaiA family ribosome-associated protein [Thermosipho ferrireducens]|uniref:HPF/RaiA family ribosome-associated protein n=1 Tax=Thermosipho ferrireducens TaxID=2571116 RepID=A0ABX7S614_9BACT|nr:sigma 54 modulation/S30EA ribosomal C-terminal domain-containing protein [Thermosipho ferrireducens]QTA37165.1 HPF/RaiA family ribosome-associated protein [Thermosipho ferrireducens]